ncbi:MAG: biopolymer transporter ExbD [Chthoniobacterales bacterium]|nr:biopolymer transporter ExbD [Chthoniobacterales bacterium]
MQIGSPIPHKKARIEIIPLIDIMFFLLASFMMVSLSQTHMKGIKVALPTGQSGESQSKSNYISVSVNREGNFFFDKEPLDFTGMSAKLMQAHTTNPEAKVFVRGDREALHGNIVRLLNLCRSSGFYKLSFEIKSEALKGIPGGG